MAILDTQILRGILENLNQVNGIKGSAVVSRDGLIMVSTFDDPGFNDKLGAMTTASLNPANSTLEELSLGKNWALILLGTEGGLLVKEIDDDMVLSVVVNPGTSIAPVVEAMKKAVNEILG